MGGWVGGKRTDRGKGVCDVAGKDELEVSVCAGTEGERSLFFC